MAATSERRRYAVVGTGSRARLYIDAFADRFVETADLVALCDTSRVRMAWHAARIAPTYPDLVCYQAEEFGRMLTDVKPDVVIVITVDRFHAEYIVAALDHGCDIITEKPVAVTADQLEAVAAAEKRSGRKVRVIFNARYAPEFGAIRKLLLDGRIGAVHLVELAEILDTSHGADYFRRWHRQKANSGGLLIHKACHHFDLVNWWLDDQPRRVFAAGSLAFYGKRNAERRGEEYRYERYTAEAGAEVDPFALMLDRDESLRGLFLEAEEETGYLRDVNVFAGGIDIEDTAAVTVEYQHGAILAYSLVAYSPWEGMRLALTGDRGRIQLDLRVPSELLGTGVAQVGTTDGGHCRLMVSTMFGDDETVDVGSVAGGHANEDASLLGELFGGRAVEDPLGRSAGLADGIAAVLVGAAANRSLVTGAAVDCASLFELPSLA